MEHDPNVDKIAAIVSAKVQTSHSPSGQPFVELQLLVQAHPAVPPQHFPWVRMSIDSAAQLIDQLATTVAAAQGVFEPTPRQTN